MDFWPTVLAGVVVLAIGGAGAVILSRPRRRATRFMVGHEVTCDIETNVERMHIPAGVEAPWVFCFSGVAPEPPPTPFRGNGDIWHWAHDEGGDDAQTTVLQITVQGGGDGPVSIEPPELEDKAVVRASDCLLYGQFLGGNGIHSRRYRFTLDGGDVTREYLDDPDERPASFMLNKGESQRLLIVVAAVDDKRHLWTIDIPVIYSGKRQTLKIRNQGGPFVTYGVKGLTAHMLMDGRWVPDGESW